MSDNDSDLVVTDDFESWYENGTVGITFIEDGVTKIINKEDFREFYKFISQTYDEFLRVEDDEDDEMEDED